MSEIHAAGTGPIGQASFSGRVSTALPFDPKTVLLPKVLPECEKSRQTNSLPGEFIAHGILPEGMSVPGAAAAIVRLDLIGRGTDTNTET